MIYVGIDIAKETHVAAAVDSDGVIIIEPFSFTNNHEGFKLLKSKLDTLDKSNLLIGLESTAHYAENVIFFLHGCGFDLAVINPVQTAAMRKTDIRKTKTDKVDSLLICKTLMVNSFKRYTENDIKTLKLKSLCRFRQNLKKSKARLKIQLTSYVDVIFPELQSFFKSGLHIKTCYELLKAYSSPDDIAALHLTKLSNILSKASRGRFGKQDAQSLKSLAMSSVGVKNTYISIQIIQTIAQIELIEIPTQQEELARKWRFYVIYAIKHHRKMWRFFTFGVVAKYNFSYLFWKYQFMKELFSVVNFINNDKHTIH